MTSVPVPAKKTPIWIRVVRTLVVSLGGFYLLVCILLLFFQNKLLFYPDRGLPPPPKQQVPEVEQISFDANDGVKLVSWWMPPKKDQPTVIFFQGNAGNISDRSDRLFDCKEHGWGILLLGYRGYGTSAGSPGEAGLYLDARAALGFLRSRPDVNLRRLVYYGESLGCSIALELAVAEPPACVVLEAPFRSLKAIAAVHYWWLPTSLLVRSDFDNVAKAAGLKCPLFVAHGLRDEVVPFAQGRAVFDAAPEPKTFFQLDSRHNDIAESGSKPYRSAVAEFIDKATR